MSARASIDLPVEIWLYIISFLPRGKVRRKLIGLNRVFYEAVMDDILAEVEFRTNDAWRHLERLKQIQYAWPKTSTSTESS